MPFIDNNYYINAMAAILKNERAPLASMNGIIQAANNVPGALAAQAQFTGEASYKGPPKWSKEIEVSNDSTPVWGSAWKERRDNLNVPGRFKQTRDELEQIGEKLTNSRPSFKEVREGNMNASDEARKQDRNALTASFAQARARSGKSQVAQQVRNAYMNHTGANIQAARLAFVSFAG